MPYLDDWTKFMLAQGRSDATIKRYRYALHRLAGESGKDSLLEITETDVTTFLASLGKRAHSRQLYLQAFRSFFPWAVERKLMASDPARYLRPKAPIEPEPDAYTPEEIALLLSAAKRKNVKWAWAIQACYALGLRRAELCGITDADIDWGGRRVFIREAKGDRPRWTEMNLIAEEALLELSRPPRVSAGERTSMEAPRGAVGHPEPGQRVGVALQGLCGTMALQTLNSGRSNSRLGDKLDNPLGNKPILGYHPQWFSMIVHQAAVDAGFPPGRRNAHLLRSSFATHLLGKGVPISVVSKLLGHSQIATTSRYLAVRGEDRRAAVDSLSLAGVG